MTHQDPRELARLAAALSDCAARLQDRVEDSPEVERVQRLLRRTAADLAPYAVTARRLDDELELLLRRHVRSPHELEELRRRRRRADARLVAEIDGATRALVPGGDRLDPTTILRRLSGDPVVRRSYFGRPAVDRRQRVRRLTALLLRGAPTGHPRRNDTHATTIVVPSHATRLARVRNRLLRSVHPHRHTTGAPS